MIDKELWRQVQRIVYPKRWPSENRPYPFDGTSPKKRAASWLYHTLANDAELRAKVLP